MRFYRSAGWVFAATTALSAGGSAILGCAAAPPLLPAPAAPSPPPSKEVETSATSTPPEPAPVAQAAPSAIAAPPPVSGGPPSEASESLVSDEPIYLVGARTRPKGSPVDVSHDDEIVATWNHGGTGESPAETGEAKPPHAAPRIKVDVVEVRGDIREPDVQRAARAKSYWPFRICYEKGLRRVQKLHGKIQLQLTLGPSGTPTTVRPLSSELSDAEVVRCIVKSASLLGLPAPSSGMPQVKLDVSLWPGDEPIVSRGVRGKGRLPDDTASLATALSAHKTDVRICYDAGLKKHPLLWGRLALRLRVVDGRIVEGIEVESHFPDPDVTSCVAKVFLETTLPSTEHEIQFVYPLRLGKGPEATASAR